MFRKLLRRFHPVDRSRVSDTWKSYQFRFKLKKPLTESAKRAIVLLDPNCLYSMEHPDTYNDVFLTYNLNFGSAVTAGAKLKSIRELIRFSEEAVVTDGDIESLRDRVLFIQRACDSFLDTLDLIEKQRPEVKRSVQTEKGPPEAP